MDSVGEMILKGNFLLDNIGYSWARAREATGTAARADDRPEGTMEKACSVAWPRPCACRAVGGHSALGTGHWRGVSRATGLSVSCALSSLVVSRPVAWRRSSRPLVLILCLLVLRCRQVLLLTGLLPLWTLAELAAGSRLPDTLHGAGPPLISPSLLAHSPSHVSRNLPSGHRRVPAHRSR